VEALSERRSSENNSFSTGKKLTSPFSFLLFLSVGSRRFQSTTSTTFLHKHKKETIRRNWLSDPSAYPLIVVMGAAGVLVVGIIGSGLLYNPDVQINPDRRGNIIRHWSW
jgi:hypothetical protein